MRFIIFGLGSMGKRRIRCLAALGYTEVYAYDVREDRRKEAENLYGVKTIDSVDAIDFDSVTAFIISTPPDKHLPYINLAIDHNIPAFVEASVIHAGLEKANKHAKQKGVLVAPSCTLRYHPAIRDIKEIVRCGQYGRVTNFSYHSL